MLASLFQSWKALQFLEKGSKHAQELNYDVQEKS